MNSSSKNSRLYWMLQILGWSFYGLMGLFSVSMYLGVTAKVGAHLATGAIILLLFTHLFRGYVKRNKWLALSFPQLLWRLLIATLIIATVSQLIASVNMLWVFEIATVEEYNIKYLWIYIFQTQVFLIIWSLIYFSYQYFRNYKNEEVEKWKLQAAVKNAELIALKAQINPHFLFNCLNNIKALVLEDSEKSREMISRLSDMLRYSVRYDNVELVTLGEELSVVRDYLALESIQLEERLVYDFDIDPEICTAKLPHMAVQLLVENAIKHAISILPNGGRIDISARKDNDLLEIQVVNTGQLKEGKSDGSGIGLDNIRERLTLLFGETCSLVVANLDEQSVLAKMILPLKK